MEFEVREGLVYSDLNSRFYSNIDVLLCRNKIISFGESCKISKMYKELYRQYSKFGKKMEKDLIQYRLTNENILVLNKKYDSEFYEELEKIGEKII